MIQTMIIMRKTPMPTGNPTNKPKFEYSLQPVLSFNNSNPSSHCKQTESFADKQCGISL